LPNANRNYGDKIIEKKNDFLTEFISESESVFNDKIKLEDGISINVIKSHGEKRIKKFLHVPDFEIYVIKVLSLFLFLRLLINHIGNSVE